MSFRVSCVEHRDLPRGEVWRTTCFSHDTAIASIDGGLERKQGGLPSGVHVCQLTAICSSDEQDGNI